MKKYKTSTYPWKKPIEIVEVENETLSHIWINNTQYLKYTDTECYFNTLKEAKEHLLIKLIGKMRGVENQFKFISNLIDKLKEIS